MEQTLVEKIKAVMGENVQLEHPKVEEFGDYSCNLAKLKLSSYEVEKLMTDLRKLDEIKKVEVINGSFLNISLQNSYFSGFIDRVLKDGVKSITPLALKGKRVIVEYTDPNPFKELHIGHLYSNLIGESVARMLEFIGATVWRADFYGDVGIHTAKSVWGMRQKLIKENLRIGDLAVKSIRERQNFLGQGYAMGAVEYEKNEAIKQEINHLNTLIYAIAQDLLVEEKGWKPIVDYHKFVNAPEFDYVEIKEIYKSGLKWSLDYFETLYSMLGTKFDGYYPESLVGEYGYQLVMEGLEKGLFRRSEGAVIFEGVHTRVFVNKNNLPTYEAKDMGLAVAKYKDFPYDLDINVTGNEIKEYFKVVIPALTAVRPEIGKVTFPLTHGMVNLPEGKMSSRSGNVITVEGLFEEAAEYATKLLKDDGLTSEEKNKIAVSVGKAAIRYAFLKSGVGNDISFSFKESVTFDGNSGPYLQYTYARTRSVLNKSGREGEWKSISSYDFNEEELRILRWLYRFPEVILEAGTRYAPNLVCTYLYELAQRFNSFYNKHSILTPNAPDLRTTPSLVKEGEGGVLDGVRNFRLAMTAAVGEILKTGLGLLGIEALERM